MSQNHSTAPQQEVDDKAEPGSLKLNDPDRETFCQELVATGDLYASFEAAGFKRPRGNAQRMLRELEVAERIGYLYRKIAPLEEALLLHRRHEYRKTLHHIAHADRLSLWEEKNRYITVGKKRRRVRSLELKPLDKMTPDERALIDNLRISEKGIIEPVMPKRLEALDMLGKLDGHDAPTRIETTGKDGGPIAINDISDHARAKAILSLMVRNKIKAETA